VKTNVRDTSLRALEESKVILGADQQEVFEALIELGPTYDNRILEYLRQKESIKSRDKRRPNLWEKSDITGRRNQLMRKCQIGNQGIVVDLGSYFCKTIIRNKLKIKKYRLWAIRYEQRPVPAGWYKNIEDVPGYKKPKEFLPNFCRNAAAGMLF
jgi:hypothetical protein